MGHSQELVGAFEGRVAKVIFALRNRPAGPSILTIKRGPSRLAPGVVVASGLLLAGVDIAWGHAERESAPLRGAA